MGLLELLVSSDLSSALSQVYSHYAESREKQIETYKSFTGPAQYSTLCRACGCRRVFGRRGFFFCTEGCCSEQQKPGDPAPPFDHRDIDDDNDASVVLRKVLGEPPANVVYKRWMYDEECNEQVMVTWQRDGAAGAEVDPGNAEPAVGKDKDVKAHPE